MDLLLIQSLGVVPDLEGSGGRGTRDAGDRGGGYVAFEAGDGKLLYFTSRNRRGLWSMPVAGGRENLVLDAVRYFWWAIAERGIYFVPYAGEGSRHSSVPLDFYSFETNRLAQVTALERELPTTTSSISVSRDGRHVAVLQVDNPGADIELIEDFR